jgi:hypothetical protein
LTWINAQYSAGDVLSADALKPGKVMIDAGEIGAHFRRSLEHANAKDTPFRHWLLSDVLPEAVATAIPALPFSPPAIDDTAGKRETHNSTRLFFSPEARQRFAVCAAVSEALQRRDVVDALGARCGAHLAGSFLRIEYCQDTAGFWLEPHTDIGAKRFTMLVYLSAEPGCADWGTDLMNAAGEVVATAPYRANHGLIFLPGSDTWHGFRKRPILGVRRSLIVNYVEGWRSRHELAYPDRTAA